MAVPQNFRSAFNGFNREDVVQYLEYINNKHNAQVNQLTSELEGLRSRLGEYSVEELLAQVEALTQERDSLSAQLADAREKISGMEERCAELEAREQAPAEQDASAFGISEELAAYRRAERTEREARERAELMYHQANGVLSDATAKVDGIADEITEMADHVMRQLTQLQMAVSSSKQALQDAAAIMNTIRPNR